MSWRRSNTRAVLFIANVLFAVLITCSTSFCGQPESFADLGGSWSGDGMLNWTDGTSERLNCRASYDVISSQAFQLRLLCASDNYKFELLGSARARDGVLSGSWTEATRNVAGDISGSVNANILKISAHGSAFSAEVTIVTKGQLQKVTLLAPEHSVRNLSITMHR